MRLVREAKHVQVSPVCVRIKSGCAHLCGEWFWSMGDSCGSVSSSFTRDDS